MHSGSCRCSSPPSWRGEPDCCQCLARPAGARYAASWPGPARPRSGREALDDLDSCGNTRGVELEPVLDPLVVLAVGVEPGPLRSPADVANSPGQSALAGSRGLALRRGRPGAVDRDEINGLLPEPCDGGGHRGKRLQPEKANAINESAVEPLAAAPTSMPAHISTPGSAGANPWVRFPRSSGDRKLACAGLGCRPHGRERRPEGVAAVPAEIERQVERADQLVFKQPGLRGR